MAIKIIAKLESPFPAAYFSAREDKIIRRFRYAYRISTVKMHARKNIIQSRMKEGNLRVKSRAIPGHPLLATIKNSHAILPLVIEIHKFSRAALLY